MKQYALFSGGKDSTVMTHVLMGANSCDGVLTIDTTISEPDWLPFIQRVCKERDWPLEILRRKDGKTFDDFVRSYGFPHAGAHWLVMRYLKIRPLEDFYRLHKNEDKEILFASGVRRHESNRRLKTVQPVSKIGQLRYTAPIHEWTTKQVWKYIETYKLEISPCYKFIHMSGDCRCGAYADLGEAEQEALFYPSTAQHITNLEKETKKLGLKYCRWGNKSSMSGAIKQRRMDQFLCQGCFL